ncbi:hypothetical protein IEQ34_003760 [Dendrobium chrysotoxum]|uniref:Complex I assembly factor TIMMDC1, mitochondrial n=1 Tax=Dendrobium chrysotoxum TaxID=161865 RepID=A0AAV7HDY7_DENCH|nr:hypothetical protein IEQ34_003760 [Dendrobium chrysotoxum]
MQQPQKTSNTPFQRQDERERSTPRLLGTGNWGTATVMGVLAGILYGGSKEAAASVSKDAEVMLKLGSTTDKREQYQLMRDAMEKRFLQVARGSIVGGVRLGIFTATFYGLLNLLADSRGVHDAFNVAGAGSLKWRARNVLLGSTLGAGICFPLGWLQIKLVEKANEQILRSDRTGETNTSAVGAAIERLEGSLKK